jgi:uncharacterized membrane protein
LVKQPVAEDINMPFHYASRYRGKQKHETMIYPEVGFNYGIHYEGEQYVTDNQSRYKLRVDAYPAKEIEVTVSEETPQESERQYEVKMAISGLSSNAEGEVEYAVNWQGSFEQKSYGDVKSQDLLAHWRRSRKRD